jgi:F0F1-type ATP synthase assembly protein I
VDEAPETRPSGPAEPGRPDASLGPAVAFLTLGLRMAGALVVCGGLGYLVDDWLGTSPVFVLLGVALGVAAAVGQAVITVRRYL